MKSKKVYECRLENSQDIVRIEAIQSNIIHCVFTRKEEAAASSLGIENQKKIDFLVNQEDKKIILTTEDVVLKIDSGSGVLSWMDKRGKVLLQEAHCELKEKEFVEYVIDGDEPIVRHEKTVDGERNFIENLVPKFRNMAYQAKLGLVFQKDETIHGFGQGEDGIFNYRGHIQYLYQHNMRIPIPFMVSNKKYAILIDCGCLMTFEDGEESCILLDSVEQLDFYFIYGEQLDDLIAGYRKLTGKAVMLPKWAFGYIQSKEAYHTQQEILRVAKRYRKEKLPIDCIVQDWNTWEEGAWGNKKVDKKRYPDIAAMNRQLHEMNIHSMISIWPTMNSGTDNYEEMNEKDFLLKDYTTYNAFLEEARELYWKQVSEELFSGGFDAWWCDSTEPFSGPDWNGTVKRDEKERFRLVGEEHKKYLNAHRANLYAVAHAKGIYENQRKENREKRVVNLTRSGYPSSQKYGTILWSGDICATWDVLRKQIVEGISLGISGMPYWSVDIGGFFTVRENWQHRGCFCNQDSTMKWFWSGDYEEGVEDLGYRELYVRWFQFSTFLPILRSHGTDTPREIWNFGKMGEMFYDALVDMLTLRYRLLPYIYSQAANVWMKDGTIFRGLLFDYPDDAVACALCDEYMFGKSFLVCPITQPMYFGRSSTELNTDKNKKCYLPKGNAWYDFYTGEKYQGGSWVDRVTPLNELPVFVKEGSIIPMECGLQYAMEEVVKPLEIHIYGGKDAEFSYYEDAGDGYAYEDGDYQIISMSWKDKKRELTIGEANKHFPQSIVGRKLLIKFGGIGKEVVYRGKKMVVCLE